MAEIKALLRQTLLTIAKDIEENRTANCVEKLENISEILLDEMSQIDILYQDVAGLVIDANKMLREAEEVNTIIGQKPNIYFTHTRGRPFYDIPKETLHYYIENEFSVNDIASIMNVSARTIARRLQFYNMSVTESYCPMTDDELDEIVSRKIHEFPNSGYRTICGHLKSAGYRVQQTRVRESVKRVDPCAVAVRRLFMQHYRIKRRSYNVRAPMSLWHVDTNHKLIRWRFVIHAGIDGFSRLPTYVVIASDNTAATALTAFQSGVKEYGLPEKVRTDKGRENIGIAEFMLQHRGINSNCHITGRSVHNQRIERFWREVWQGCTATFHQLFFLMEEEGIMDVDNELDILALHLVFLERMQDSLSKFRLAVSRRPLRTEGNKTPLQLWILGQTLDPRVDLTTAEAANYGVDFQAPTDASTDEDIVVPSLYSVPENILNGVTEIKNRLSESVFGTDTFVAVKSYLQSHS